MDAEGWNERYSEAELVWTAKPNVFVEQILGQQEPGRALDVAAGEGRHAVWLATKGWVVEAVDFSDVGLERARRWAEEEGVSERLVTVVADVCDFEPAPGGFDAVLLAYVQLPRVERLTAIGNAARGVDIGGVLVVVAHDSSNLDQGTGGPPDPAVLYSVADVLEDLKSSSYEWHIERAEVVERDVSGAERPARDTVVVARRTG